MRSTRHSKVTATTKSLWKPSQPQSEQRQLIPRFVASVCPSGDMVTETRSRTFPDSLLRDWSRTIGTSGTVGTRVSILRIERSKEIERLERLERRIGFRVGSHIPRGLKKGIRKFSQDRLCLSTPACYGRPAGAPPATRRHLSGSCYSLSQFNIAAQPVGQFHLSRGRTVRREQVGARHKNNRTLSPRGRNVQAV